MKTPREILLKRHQAAEPKLDHIREAVLADKLSRPAATRSAGFLSTLNSQLSTIFWPNPRAWAGLAVVWLLIFAFRFASADGTAAVARKPVKLSAEYMAVLREQHRLATELIGSHDLSKTGRSGTTPPAPRTERRMELLVA